MKSINLKVSFNSIILSFITSLFTNDIQDIYKAYALIFLPLKFLIFVYYKYNFSNIDINLFLLLLYLFIQFLFNSLAAGSRGESSKYNYIKYDLVFSTILFLILESF